MNGRVYDAKLGRFLSADPVWTGDLADPQSLNPYSYVQNRPLSLIDPSGFMDEIVVSAKQDSGPQSPCDTKLCLEPSIGSFHYESYIRLAQTEYAKWLRNIPKPTQPPANTPPPTNTDGDEEPQTQNPEPALLSVVYEGETKRVVAGNTIRLEPFGIALGAEHFSYHVDYNYMNDGEIISNIGPPNMPPFFTGGAVVGFGGGAPDVTLVAPDSHGYSGSVMWSVSIPKQPSTHDNNSWGYGIRIYGVKP